MTNSTVTLADISNRLNQDYGGKELGLPSGFFITDNRAQPEPEKVIAQLPKEFAVIFRDYDHPGRQELGRVLRQRCRERGLRFLVAGNEALAHEIDADGLHLPEALMSKAAHIRGLYPRWLITAACHGEKAVKKAGKLGIDAGLIAPVFPTVSHPETIDGSRPTLGLTGVRDLVKASKIPLYALGGVTKDNACQLMGSGVAGIAAIRGFCVANPGS